MAPHVAYSLTPTGITLLQAVDPLIGWSVESLEHIDRARADYDNRVADSPAAAS
jgi:DNA-binding HxlR family transcriptional regulator